MFEKSTWIRLPRNVVVGHGVLGEAVDVVADLGLAGPAVVVTSPTAAEVAGAHLADALADAGHDPETVVVEDASFGAVERVVAAAREREATMLVGVGGGKPIDIAKM
ncbi:MAG: iron-containing alcohol dehydrogenase, partial [Halobacteriaceae archaeon]